MASAKIKILDNQSLMPVAVGFELVFIPGPATYDAGDIDFTDQVGFEVRVVSQIDVLGGIRIGGSTTTLSAATGGIRIGGSVADYSQGGIRIGGKAFSYTLVESSGGIRIGGEAVNYISGGIRIGGRAETPTTDTFDVYEYWILRDLRTDDPYDSWMHGELTQ